MVGRLQSTRLARRGFTLVEVLITITIIGLLTSLFLAALAASQQQAREARTKSMIARLDAVIMSRWESYRTRRVPINTTGLNPSAANGLRLLAMRELQRLEMPQRWEDVVDDPSAWPSAAPVTTTSGIPIPGLSLGYRRRFNASSVTSYNGTTTTTVATQPTSQYQGAECLYLIVTCGGLEEDVTPIDQFRGLDVGDLDRDGMPEFHDGWGNPITFLRWAPGWVSDVQPNPGWDFTTYPRVPTPQAAPAPYDFAIARHDAFDPAKLAFNLPSTTDPNPRGFVLSPLIMSPGPDGILDTWHVSGDATDFPAGLLPANLNDPYYVPASAGRYPSGWPLDYNAPVPTGIPTPEGYWLDNIHNQQLGALAK
ncbi:MAG: type II secretion system protein [Pirellulales bacterium]